MCLVGMSPGSASSPSCSRRSSSGTWPASPSSWSPASSPGIKVKADSVPQFGYTIAGLGEANHDGHLSVIVVTLLVLGGRIFLGSLRPAHRHAPRRGRRFFAVFGLRRAGSPSSARRSACSCRGCCVPPAGSDLSPLRSKPAPRAPPPAGLATDNILTARTFFSTRNGYSGQTRTRSPCAGCGQCRLGDHAGLPGLSSGSRTTTGTRRLAHQVSSHRRAARLSSSPALRARGAGVLRPLGALVIWAASRAGGYILVPVVMEFGARVRAGDRRHDARRAHRRHILYGVLVAVGLSVLDLLRRVSRPHDGIRVRPAPVCTDVDDCPEATTQVAAGPSVYRYDSRSASPM